MGFSNREIVWDSMLRPGTQLLAFSLAFFGLESTESEGFDNFCCPSSRRPWESHEVLPSFDPVQHRATGRLDVRGSRRVSEHGLSDGPGGPGRTRHEFEFDALSAPLAEPMGSTRQVSGDLGQRLRLGEQCVQVPVVIWPLVRPLGPPTGCRRSFMPTRAAGVATRQVTVASGTRSPETTVSEAGVAESSAQR